MTFRERWQAWRYNLVPDHIDRRDADQALGRQRHSVPGAGRHRGGVRHRPFRASSSRQSLQRIRRASSASSRSSSPASPSSCSAAASTCRSARSSRSRALPPSRCSSSSSSRCGWRCAASIATGLACRRASTAISSAIMRLRAFLTTLVTFIIGRALFDILVVAFAAADPAVARHLRYLGLHRRRHVPGPVDLGADGDRDRASSPISR